jgi:acyl-CoA synthetase (AMP-forming)/AMP-acid ligase II
MLTNGNLFSNAVNAVICCHIPLGGVEVVPFPLFFSAIFNSHVIPYMLAEGGVVILDRFHPEHLIDAINKERPTYTTLNPTMLNDFITHPGFQECELGSLQGILVAAAPLSLTRMQRAWRALGKILVQGYGLTESTSFSTCTRIDDYDESDMATFRRRLTSVGRAVPTLEINVVDEQGGDIPHNGEATGEIVVRGPSVMAGYWKQPETTKAAIKDGWLHTGDLGTMDEEGYVWMVGRKKDMIISGGINIYPEEVEAVLYTLPEIEEVAVVGRPDERWGEAVTAIVVVKPGEKIGEETVVAHCRQKIASYKKPTRVVFVDRLPHNASGKIKKNMLRETLARGEL